MTLESESKPYIDYSDYRLPIIHIFITQPNKLHKGYKVNSTKLNNNDTKLYEAINDEVINNTVKIIEHANMFGYRSANVILPFRFIISSVASSSSNYSLNDIKDYINNFKNQILRKLKTLKLYDSKKNLEKLEKLSNRIFFSVVLDLKDLGLGTLIDLMLRHTKTSEIQRSNVISKRLNTHVLNLLPKLKKEFDLVFLDLTMQIDNINEKLYNGPNIKSFFSILNSTIQKLMKNKNIDIIFNAENNNFKDNLKYKNSGIDNVLARIMQQTSKLYLFDVTYLSNAEHKIIAKMIQNIKFLRKAKVKFAFTKFVRSLEDIRNYHDIFSIASLFNVNKGETKLGEEELLVKIIKNRLAALGLYYEPGIYHKVLPLEFFNKKDWWRS